MPVGPTVRIRLRPAKSRTEEWFHSPRAGWFRSSFMPGHRDAARQDKQGQADVDARACMIERGYGLGERAAALLGSAATADTLALV